MVTTTSSAEAIAQRLCEAINRHDLDALAACFAPDFVNDTPVHPARSFKGRETVRENWTQILAAVPDLQTVIVRSAVAGETVWVEWEMAGTRADGAPHLMRGVTIFGVENGRFARVRFYVEPVEQGGPGVGQAVREQVGR